MAIAIVNPASHHEPDLPALRDSVKTAFLPKAAPLVDDEKIKAGVRITNYRSGNQVRLTESVFGADLREQIGGAGFPFGDPDHGTEFSDRLFQPIDAAGRLDLSPRQILTTQRLSIRAYRQNPRAFRMIELIKDFVLGDGVRFFAQDDDVQKLLNEHWEVNRWDDKVEKRLRALAIFGEQLYAATTNEKTGIVLIDAISPIRIRNVDADPMNGEEIWRVKTTMRPTTTTTAPGQKGRNFDIIRPDQNGILRGDAFYFGINQFSGSRRGIPDLLTVIDWLEGLDGFVFALLERSDLAAKVVWDVLYKGLQEEEIEEQVDRFTAQIRDGSVFGHNENIEITPKAPQLGSSEAETVVSIILKKIQAGTGLAGLFFGDSDDLTRASASELTVPVAKNIQGRQNFFRRMISTIFTYQIQEAKRVGRLKEDADPTFRIVMSKVFLRDTSTITSSLVSLSTALSTAVLENWLNVAEAAAVFRSQLEQLGAPIDPTMRDLEESRPELDAYWRQWQMLVVQEALDGNGAPRGDRAARAGS